MGINSEESVFRGQGSDEEESMKGLRMEITELKAVKVVGKGAMGTVFLAHKEGCDKALALKAISKPAIEKQNDGFKRARAELDILRRLRHPFLPSLVGHVETDKVVGFVMDYCPGGDLNYLRRKQSEKTFSESIIRFYTAEIILALEHLHSLGIVYRDLKTENILVQSNGHIMLTDFDLSTRLRPHGRRQEPSDGADPGQPKSQIRRSRSGAFAMITSCMTSQHWSPTRVSPLTKSSKRSSSKKSEASYAALPNAPTPTYERANSFVGTEEYVSPEMLRGDGHDFAVDWWALGILVYEMLHGKTPFRGATRKETFYNILVRQPHFTGPWNPLRDLIVRLLEKEPSRRIGFTNGAAEIKKHRFFNGLDWEAMENVSRAPFLPPPMTPEDLIADKILNVEEFFEKQAESKLKEEENSVVKEKAPDTEEKDAFTVF